MRSCRAEAPDRDRRGQRGGSRGARRPHGQRARDPAIFSSGVLYRRGLDGWSPDESGGTWNVEELDRSDGAFNSLEAVSLALDSAGNPHIGYYRLDVETQLEYLARAGPDWSAEIVIAWPFEFNDSDEAALALDDADRPHFVYTVPHGVYDPDTAIGSTEAGVRYSARAADGWSQTVIGHYAFSVNGVSIAFGDGDVPASPS